MIKRPHPCFGVENMCIRCDEEAHHAVFVGEFQGVVEYIGEQLCTEKISGIEALEKLEEHCRDFLSLKQVQ
ncbi:hypothetical protein [Halodesulfovibrio spirochaetisodalis]|nr:hypothetical protein [Halodesulfovibrio spirochaetisodalis]